MSRVILYFYFGLDILDILTYITCMKHKITHPDFLDFPPHDWTWEKTDLSSLQYVLKDADGKFFGVVILTAPEKHHEHIMNCLTAVECI